MLASFNGAFEAWPDFDLTNGETQRQKVYRYLDVSRSVKRRGNLWRFSPLAGWDGSSRAMQQLDCAARRQS